MKKEEEGKTVEEDKCEEILTTLQQISDKLVNSVQVSDDVALIGQLNKIKVMFFFYNKDKSKKIRTDIKIYKHNYHS